jgi:hypothetical protein
MELERKYLREINKVHKNKKTTKYEKFVQLPGFSTK